MIGVAECPKCRREAFSWDARAKSWMCPYRDCLHSESSDEYLDRDLKQRSEALKERRRDRAWIVKMADAEDELTEDGWNGCTSAGGLLLEAKAMSRHRLRMIECGVPEKDRSPLAMFVEGMLDEGHPFNRAVGGNPEYRKFANDVLGRRIRKTILLGEALQRLDESGD